MNWITHWKKIGIKVKQIFKKQPLGQEASDFKNCPKCQKISYKPDLYVTRNFFTCFLLVLLRKKVIIEVHHDLNNESRIVKKLIKFTKYLHSE